MGQRIGYGLGDGVCVLGWVMGCGRISGKDSGGMGMRVTGGGVCVVGIRICVRGCEYEQQVWVGGQKDRL